MLQKLAKRAWSAFNAGFVAVKKPLFFLLIGGLFFAGPIVINHGLVTGRPPPIASTMIDGREALPQAGKGVSVIYFWAQWCGICNIMKDTLSSVLDGYPGVTIAIKSGDDRKLSEYLQSQGLTWPVVNDPHGEIAEQYRVRGVPALFYLNQNGEIVLTSTGYSSSWGIKFRLWLADKL